MVRIHKDKVQRRLFYLFLFSFFSSQWRIKLKTNQTWNSLRKTPYQNTNKIKTALKLKIHQSYDLKIADRILCSFNSLAGSNQTNPHASKLKYECVENAKVISYHLCNFTNIYCLISFSLHHILPLIHYLLENFWASWLWILLIIRGKGKMKKLPLKQPKQTY